jgi:hypothetical protein
MLATALTDIPISSQISFKFFDNGVKQARGKRSVTSRSKRWAVTPDQ